MTPYGSKWASNDRFCCWQDKCFVSLASTIVCGQGSSSFREMAALMSPAMTFESPVMTCLPKRVTYSLNGFLRGIAVVKNIASAPDSFNAADDRDRGSGI